MPVRVVELTQVTEVKVVPPMVMFQLVDAEPKLLPVIVTAVPPVTGPLLATMLERVGSGL